MRVPCSSQQVLFHCLISVVDFYNVHSFPVQLSEQLSAKGFLPIFNFLGSLVEAVPNVAHSLVTQYGETLQQKTQSHPTVILALVYKEKQHCVSVCFLLSFFVWSLPALTVHIKKVIIITKKWSFNCSYHCIAVSLSKSFVLNS